MQIRGHHHLSAITASGPGNFHFYNKVLGMKLVKKTVNQDDTSVYHLFYGDERGNPGTELTFFEFPMAGRFRPGTGSISLTSLRVANDEALTFWKRRFEELQVEHDEISVRGGRQTLAFRDPEGQRLALVSDEHNEGVAGGVPWSQSVIPPEFAIRGLGPIHLTVNRAERTAFVLTELLGFRSKGGYPSDAPGQPDVQVFETGEGGTGSEIHLEERRDMSRETPGSGGVHHVAFRVADEAELREWIAKIEDTGLRNSGFVDRFYFRSFYFREPNGILFELATDGPGFDTDEDIERLGEKLALPPFLEPNRAQIEARLAPLEIRN